MPQERETKDLQPSVFPFEAFLRDDFTDASNPFLALVNPWKFFSRFSVKTASADYTVLDDDGFSFISMTTGASGKTVTLPTAADNKGRMLIIEKVDTGTGYVIIDGEGAETINGQATWTLHYIRDFLVIICDGTEWRIISEARPVGEIIAMGRYTTGTPAPAPVGFLWCDGAEASRTVYARLFAAIGTAWGDGDASTTFNLPTCDGVFLRGRDSGTTYDPDSATRPSLPALAGATGRNVGSYQTNQNASHFHNVNAVSGTGNTDERFSQVGTTAQGTNATNASGGNEARPTNVYVEYYIRY